MAVMVMYTWLVLLSAAVFCNTQSVRPPYIGCLDSRECGKGECCVIGMGRFSIPYCKPRQDLGEDCRPNSEPVNTTLQYPDNAVVELTDVYHILCPCLGGLTCGGYGDGDNDNPQCRESQPSNHLYQFSEELMDNY